MFWRISGQHYYRSVGVVYVLVPLTENPDPRPFFSFLSAILGEVFLLASSFFLVDPHPQAPKRVHTPTLRPEGEKGIIQLCSSGSKMIVLQFAMVRARKTIFHCMKRILIFRCRHYGAPVDSSTEHHTSMTNMRHRGGFGRKI